MDLESTKKTVFHHQSKRCVLIKNDERAKKGPIVAGTNKLKVAHSLFVYVAETRGGLGSVYAGDVMTRTCKWQVSISDWSLAYPTRVSKTCSIADIEEYGRKHSVALTAKYFLHTAVWPQQGRIFEQLWLVKWFGKPALSDFAWPYIQTTNLMASACWSLSIL